MATPFTDTLERIIALAQATFEDVTVIHRDENDFRAVLRLVEQYRDYQVHLREVLRPDGSRKYAYYVIQAGQVFAGFDNMPDTEALRLKYGNEYSQHRQETIPHFHSQHKQTVELTDEMTAEAFFEWLEQNL
jgi:hypothetical protein